MATIIGGITAYPINQYLVVKKLKHGCMTKGEDAEEPIEQKAHSHHKMAGLDIKTQWYFIGGTFLALFIIVFITGFFVPIPFT